MKHNIFSPNGLSGQASSVHQAGRSGRFSAPQYWSVGLMALSHALSLLDCLLTWLSHSRFRQIKTDRTASSQVIEATFICGTDDPAFGPDAMPGKLLLAGLLLRND